MNTSGLSTDQNGDRDTNNNDSVILEEEINPNYIPSEQEVIDYAGWLGMDLDEDKALFWIAREGLKAPLPENWKPCKCKDTEEIYYFNFETSGFQVVDMTSLFLCYLTSVIG